ncbi:alpha-1,6-mannosyl-glycoprotein 2-beta-N-acetylglucosaminyltransferase-like isoform X2 [Convolutriloba macropyga]|uniref:alpha-1,6-mannosyl-glycoprotein 2-beta-N-acetylglucosaminyltransferase-like isoform X2 n=1 Tax=Convolutriloba macropyga TaxID=536237 RepID=UPI003F51E7A5
MLRFHIPLIRLLRYLSYLLYFSLFVLCVQYKYGGETSPPGSSDPNYPAADQGNSNLNVDSSKNGAKVPVRYRSIPQKCDNHSYVNPTAADVRSLFYKLNTEKCIRNEDSNNRHFDKLLLVMVHNRAEYLQYLIDSIVAQTNTQLLNKTLVVFSHDIYDKAVFETIERITAFQVMQIGFPYSQQIFPDTFPGQSPTDCPRDATTDQATKIGCANAEFPDSYGHYREAKYAAIKHHWWWKLNYVMRHILTTGLEDIPVLLIEEDHYLTPDAIQFMSDIVRTKQALCPQCMFSQLGDYSKIKDDNFGTQFKQLRIDNYLSNRNNMGLIVDRRAYNKLISKDCAEIFCMYDDYNWDWSLNAQSMRCENIGKSAIAKTQFMVMVPCVPRILHTGKCGVHKNKNSKIKLNLKSLQCSPEILIKEYLTKYEKATSTATQTKDGHRNSDPNSPYSTNVQYTLTNSPSRPLKTSKKIKPNGGWADPRDQQFCLKIATDQV